MYARLAPACGRRIRGRYTRCTTSRLRKRRGGYAPACARCLTGDERAALGLGGQPRHEPDYVDIAKLRAGDRD
jgi:hypothetical protein